MAAGQKIPQETVDRFVGYCALGLETSAAARAAEISPRAGQRLRTTEKVTKAIAEAQKVATGFAADFARVIGDLQNAEHSNGDPDLAAQAKGADLAGKYFDRLHELGETDIQPDLPDGVYMVYPQPPFDEE